MAPTLTLLIPMLTTHFYPVQDGFTALHAAALEDHLRVVEMLLEANADVNIEANVRVTVHLWYLLLHELQVIFISNINAFYQVDLIVEMEFEVLAK